MNDLSQNHQAKYSIGVISRLTGISVHTLRLWDRRYGLSASTRSPAGQRQYSQVDLDHLRLIKSLIDSGFKIGDIAELPHKTLSAIAQDQTPPTAQQAEPTQAAYTMAVIGHLATLHLNDHPKRFPKLSLQFPDTSVLEYIQALPDEPNIELAFFQIDSLQKKYLKPLTELKKRGVGVIVYYQFSYSDMTSQLRDAGISLYKGAPDIETMAELIDKSIERFDTFSELYKSSKKYDIPYPISYQRSFTPEQLYQASQQSSQFHCECPSHLSEIINALNAFEDYSKDCEANNWEDAAVHACVYSYTTQARALMEKALMAVMLEQDDKPNH